MFTQNVYAVSRYIKSSIYIVLPCCSDVRYSPVVHTKNINVLMLKLYHKGDFDYKQWSGTAGKEDGGEGVS